MAVGLVKWINKMVQYDMSENHSKLTNIKVKLS